MASRSLRALTAALATSACVDLRDAEHCAIEAPPQVADVTWHKDVRPIIEGRCATCHSPGNIGPFSLTDYAETVGLRDAVHEAVVERRMPPWQPARCCNTFRDDFSLTATQIAIIDRWVELGTPEGNPADAGPPLAVIGGLSRVDVEVKMPAPYTPQPGEGRVDDFRCFAADWPLDEPVYVTGINPQPGARPILHHVVVAYAEGNDAKKWDDMKSKDGRPGIECEGGIADVPITGILGGSLLGGDFPEGVGTRIEPGSKIIFNVHYSLGSATTEADLTTLQFKVDPVQTPIAESGTLILANPAWLISDAMLVKAGEVRQFRFQYDPRASVRLKQVKLRGLTPHMHEFGTSMIVGVARKDGSFECLADIQQWDFGWEQPYWFEQSIALLPGDEVYIECTFDNTADKQPVIDGVRIKPRDIAWGTDQQDMCAGFLVYSFEDEG